MDVNNALIAVAFFALGLVVAGTAFYIPVTAKRGRPKKSNSVK